MLARAEQEFKGGLALELLRSMRNTELGLKGRYRETLRDEFRRKGEELLMRSVEAG